MSGATEAKEGSAILGTYAGALADAAATAHTGPREEMGERLIRTFLAFWEDPERRPQLLETVRSAVAGGPGATQMRDFMSSQLFSQVGGALKTEPMNLDQAAEELKVPPLNLNAAAAQVWGVIMLRYILQIEPMASASADEIVAVLSPTIQRYLVG
jgi:hypothetical protein